MSPDSSGTETAESLVNADSGTRAGMSRLDELLRYYPLPSWRVFAWPIMIMVALFVAWSAFAELDEVAIATGEVVPQGQVKMIQHLEGGIIEEIFVRDGEKVSPGTKLVQLNLGSGGTNRDELIVRLDSQLLAKARFQAEASGEKPVFPEDIAKRRPNLLRGEQNAYQARINQHLSTLKLLKNQVEQKQLEVQELLTRRQSISNNLKLSQQRLGMSKELLASGLTPKLEHLQLEAEVEKLDGELKSINASIPRARAAVAEASGKIEDERVRFRREAQEEANKTEQAIGRIRELLTESTEQRMRATIRSPIHGVVKNMRYHTIGGVVKAGEPIMEIVPTGEKLVVNARLNPIDRAFVESGQRVTVKLSAYDFARYGGLDGKVLMVAPDSSTDDKGNPYFRLVVETQKTYLGTREGEYPISPGMQAQVDVHTGKKSVMDYLIKPVLKLKHEAFRER
ncbi:MAG: HlyD family type I secretion periplasmic adaptor subunit [Rhodospirillales bacterium]